MHRVLYRAQRVHGDVHPLVGRTEVSCLQTSLGAVRETQGRLEPTSFLTKPSEGHGDPVGRARSVAIRKPLHRKRRVWVVELRVRMAGLTGGLAESARVAGRGVLREHGDERIGRLTCRHGSGRQTRQEGGPREGRPPGRLEKPAAHCRPLAVDSRLAVYDRLAVGRRPRPQRRQLGLSNRVGIGSEPDGVRALFIEHVPDRATAASDLGDGEELFGDRIEAHELVGLHSGLHEPDAVRGVDGHGVRPRLRSGRIVPLLDVSGAGIEPAQPAQAVVDVPDDVVGVDDQAARSRPLVGEVEGGHLHRLRIDRGDLVGVEQGDPRVVVRVHLDPVGPTGRSSAAGDLGRLNELHVARPGNEVSDEVAALDREPQVVVPTEDQRVGVAGRFVRHPEFLDVAGLRVELADMPDPVPRVEDRAVVVHDQVVRAGAVVEGELLELPGAPVQRGGVVTTLADEPNLAVGRHVWIPRTTPLPGDLPLGDLDLLCLLSCQAVAREPERQGCE